MSHEPKAPPLGMLSTAARTTAAVSPLTPSPLDGALVPSGSPAASSALAAQAAPSSSFAAALRKLAKQAEEPRGKRRAAPPPPGRGAGAAARGGSQAGGPLALAALGWLSCCFVPEGGLRRRCGPPPPRWRAPPRPCRLFCASASRSVWWRMVGTVGMLGSLPGSPRLQAWQETRLGSESGWEGVSGTAAPTPTVTA